MNYAALANRLGVPRDKVYDVPQYMIDDEMMIMAAEAASDVTKPTQDLIAKDREFDDIRATLARARETLDGNGG